ncbi:hypothetical protein GALMADRAFT_211577 [Galerina marginata CBS 339.88]|uniref:Uncharacterized protein n=1 Tax=Galerina marginata (strain CBS 339.88) TaxID=685588 RepID=A0A067SWP2_GALM3|nr:hypothetical protein GALMADRAFT_211577 [Galerina marginata CBS 339.88]
MITSFDFEPNAIMALLHHTGSVISGSMALVSLFPGDNLIAFRPQDIDFYVPLDMKTRAESFFLTSTAYRPIINKKRYYNKYIAEVIFMRHGNKTINIIVSSGANSLNPIFHFHSTAVMNFISSTGVFSAYPSLTFVHRNLVNPEYLKNNRVIQPVEYCMTKYRERGFENGQNLSQWDDICTHKCGEDMFCPRTTRTVSDSGSFKFKFSSQPWIQSGQPDSDVYSHWGPTVWRLGGPACSDVKGGNEGFVVDCKEKDPL